MSNNVKNTYCKIRFGLKDSIKKLESEPLKESLVVMFFSSRGRRLKKSTGFKCSLKHWDINRQRVKTGKGMLENAYHVNATLSSLENYADDELTKMIKENNFIDFDRLSILISSKVNGDKDLIEKNNNTKVVSYSENLIESKKSTIGETTSRSYKQTLKLLKLYENEKKVQLQFDKINLTFYRNFVSLLETNGYSTNSIGKHIKNLKTFLNEALIEGISNNIIFKHKSFKVLKEETTQIYLTTEEIIKLAEEDLSKYPQIDLARDIFLIGCYTGQRVSDYNGLTSQNLGHIGGYKVIEIKQKKTKNVVKIPVSKSIQIILDKYNGSFPPKMSEPVLRRNIKKACELAEFFDYIKVAYTKGGKKIEENVPKYELVKTHTARRSFCTNLFKAGRRIQEIMMISGHKTEKEFYKYIRVQQDDKVLSIIKSDFLEIY